MGYSVHVLPEHRLAVVRLTDEVDGPEILRAMRALFLDRRWRPGCRVLWDARAVRVLDLLPEHLPTFAETSAELADRTGPGRSAVLGRGLHDEITVRLLDLRRRGHPDRELRAFSTWRDAAAWLEVPEAALAVEE